MAIVNGGLLSTGECGEDGGFVGSEIYSLSSRDVVYMASPLTFDPSVVEIFTTLSSGATLLILDDWTRLQPRELATLLTTVHRVTVLQVMMMFLVA